MSESNTPDITKVISMIMSNPRLIEEISAMAKGSTKDDTSETEIINESPLSYTSAGQSSAPITSPQKNSSSKESRTQLLHALKPYLSEGRARAIDTMISVADIFDTMKGV